MGTHCNELWLPDWLLWPHAEDPRALEMDNLTLIGPHGHLPAAPGGAQHRGFGQPLRVLTAPSSLTIPNNTLPAFLSSGSGGQEGSPLHVRRRLRRLAKPGAGSQGEPPRGHHAP